MEGNRCCKEFKQVKSNGRWVLEQDESPQLSISQDVMLCRQSVPNLLTTRFLSPKQHNAQNT